MVRPSRLILPSCSHHVIPCGNNRQLIFLASKYYEVSWECLREVKQRYFNAGHERQSKADLRGCE
jgi:hypothetical protein